MDDGILCNRSESSEHEDEGNAQAPQQKSHCMFSDFLPHYTVSNMVFKLPKQGDQQPCLILMKFKFIIKTSIGRTIPT